MPKSNATVRWLAWAVAGLLVSGAVSAGTVSSGGNEAGQNIVVAGGTAGEVEVPSPVTAPPAPPVAPVAPPTTALATTTTTVPRPAATVRAPVATTTTIRTLTTAAPVTTSTTAAPRLDRVTVTVANRASSAYVITVNGTVFRLAAGQQSVPTTIDLHSHGNDIVEVVSAADPECGLGDAGNYFDGGGRYTLTVVDGPSTCGPIPGPGFRVTPA